jgi:hypothetical protein
MKRYFLRASMLTAVLTACMALLPGVVPAGGSPAVKQRVELLLVQNSRGVAIDTDKNILTLKGISPTTLFFSDRPVRIAGHFNQKDYLKFWADGGDSFRLDPPNATLSVFEGGGDDLLDVVVELRNPRYAGEDLVYDITVIEGDLPASGGPASLFIDILGVWRRAARRTVWVGAAAAAPPATTITVQEPPPAPVPAAKNSESEAVARLKELKSLEKQGLITEAQYQAESQKLLNQIVE